MTILVLSVQSRSCAGDMSQKPIEQVVKEAELLAAKGVKEIIVIGQDTTYYGLDLYGKRELPRLMARLNEIPSIEWIRLMYAYPSKFPDELLPMMRDSEKICKYIDIPIQHISDSVLKSMRRGINQKRLEELLYKNPGHYPRRRDKDHVDRRLSVRR